MWPPTVPNGAPRVQVIEVQGGEWALHGVRYSFTGMTPPAFPAKFACHFFDFDGWRDGAGHSLMADDSSGNLLIWQTTRDPRDWERPLRKWAGGVVSLVASDEEQDQQEEEGSGGRHVPKHPPINWRRQPLPPPDWCA